MKPVKRESVALSELRKDDTCILAAGSGAFLVVKVVKADPGRGILLYVLAALNTVGLPEFIAADHAVYEQKVPPDARFERIVLEAGEEGIS